MRNNGVVRDTLTAIGGGAVRSFFRYAALEAPAHAGIIQRVLAIPNQRQPRALVDFLTGPEIDALLAAPNQATRLGRRDHAFLLPSTLLAAAGLSTSSSPESCRSATTPQTEWRAP
jgi:site-specific recombinase XerD